ncbi:hypothetical protein PDESU_06481 [Pontiella desulfatans]|uniref:Outer membrane protein beta-barrel domain-containing protein n=1 Tax=Pontiella desulfatans TaxID=2750659 RepID=A0A6C2UDA8_PONDE|nr:hypothetical protein [Pontiella desulfatans]VGO17879.1 hypothetical protein PDESU_06481 [Pontiella desulfatans]
MKPLYTQTLMLVIGLLAIGSFADTKTNSTAAAEPMDIRFGLGYFDGDPGMQIGKDFQLGQRSEVAVLAGGYNQDRFTFRFDADYHFILTPDSPLRIYPLAGVDFAIRSKENRIGGNLGAGLSFNLAQPFSAFVEAKYVFGDWEGFGLVIGVHF